MTSQEYLLKLRNYEEWAGGPEICALSDLLMRPIILYELKSVGLFLWPRFVFRKMTECGADMYRDQIPLHILIADSRFPSCLPYRHNKDGNHFLALFPEEEFLDKDGKKQKNERSHRNRTENA